MVAERAFVAQRLARVNVAFDDEVGLPAEASAQAGVGQNGFQFGQNVFKARPTWRARFKGMRVCQRLQFSFEGAVEEGGEQGGQLGGGLGLQALQRVHLRLQRVQLGHDPALLGKRWDEKLVGF